MYFYNLLFLSAIVSALGGMKTSFFFSSYFTIGPFGATFCDPTLLEGFYKIAISASIDDGISLLGLASITSDGLAINSRSSTIPVSANYLFSDNKFLSSVSLFRLYSCIL